MTVLRNVLFLLVLAALGAFVAHMLLSGDTGHVLAADDLDADILERVIDLAGLAAAG